MNTKECVLEVIAIDPGLQTGWAVFKDHKLVACGYGKPKDLLVEDMWRKWLRKGTVVQVEVPQFYGMDKEKNPQSILRNGILAGEYKGFFRALGATVEELSPPRKWKGTIGKPKHGEQYIIEARVLAILSDPEVELIKQSRSARAKKLNHNLIDAVGQGIWRLRKELR